MYLECTMNLFGLAKSLIKVIYKYSWCLLIGLIRLLPSIVQMYLKRRRGNKLGIIENRMLYKLKSRIIEISLISLLLKIRINLIHPIKFFISWLVKKWDVWGLRSGIIIFLLSLLYYNFSFIIIILYNYYYIIILK
jgi:hypothetical protein